MSCYFWFGYHRLPESTAHLDVVCEGPGALPVCPRQGGEPSAQLLPVHPEAAGRCDGPLDFQGGGHVSGFVYPDSASWWANSSKLQVSSCLFISLVNVSGRQEVPTISSSREVTVETRRTRISPEKPLPHQTGVQAMPRQVMLPHRLTAPQMSRGCLLGGHGQAPGSRVPDTCRPGPLTAAHAIPRTSMILSFKTHREGLKGGAGV